MLRCALLIEKDSFGNDLKNCGVIKNKEDCKMLTKEKDLDLPKIVKNIS